LVNNHFHEDGARYARRAIELAEGVPGAEDVSSMALSVLGNALRYQGDFEGALRSVHQSRTLAERMTFPNETARMFSMVAIMLREGRILGEEDAVSLGHPMEAIEVLQKGADLLEETARKDQRDSSSRTRLGTFSRELGDILHDRDPRRSLAVYDLAIQRLSETKKQAGSRRDRAELLAKSSYPLRRLNRVSEAKSRIDEALAILKGTHDYPAVKIRPAGQVYTVTRAFADHEADTG